MSKHLLFLSSLRIGWILCHLSVWIEFHPRKMIAIINSAFVVSSFCHQVFMLCSTKYLWGPRNCQTTILTLPVTNVTPCLQCGTLFWLLFWLVLPSHINSGGSIQLLTNVYVLLALAVKFFILILRTCCSLTKGRAIKLKQNTKIRDFCFYRKNI